MLALILFSSNMSAQNETPIAFNVQGGYSWLNGVVGAELQIGHFGLSGGWMPTTMPLSGAKINSYSFAGTYYSEPNSQFSSYLSVGVASQGYRYEDSWGNGATAPVTILMVGLKEEADIFSVKAGLGYGWSDQGDAWTFEATIGLVLFSNKLKNQ